MNTFWISKCSSLLFLRQGSARIFLEIHKLMKFQISFWYEYNTGLKRYILVYPKDYLTTDNCHLFWCEKLASLFTTILRLNKNKKTPFFLIHLISNTTPKTLGFSRPFCCQLILNRLCILLKNKKHCHILFLSGKSQQK